MVSYRLEVKRSAEREIRKLEAKLIERIWAAIHALEAKPRPRGSRKLSDEQNAYRVRVGDYRILYEIDDRERFVSVRAVRHRREAYR